MPKSKKASRNIVVGDVKYRWRAAGHDEQGISLTVWPEDLPGPILRCWMQYNQISVPNGKRTTLLTRQVLFTNRLVRQVIELAIRGFSYDPHTKGKPLDIGYIDKKIDLSTALRAD
jgi:hypothetical protein